MDEAGRIELVIADDNLLVLRQMHELLSLEPDLKITGEARNGLDVVKLVDAHEPDLVLMDLKMPHMDGFETAERLRNDHPHLRIVFLTMYDNEEYRAKALELGADAYLLKGLPMREVLDTIKKSVQKNL